MMRLEGWLDQPSSGVRWRERFRTVVRIAWGVVRDVMSGTIGLHAASLSYTALLSLVPLLALTFSVLKGLGVKNAIAPMLEELLRPLGESAQPIIDTLLGFVGKVDVGVLGAVGLALLTYTAISVVQKIEGAFNELWQIQQGRSWGRKFTDYLSVLMVGPLLAVAAISFIAKLRDQATTGGLAESPASQHALQPLFALAPYLVVLVAFTALYAFLPNTRVRLRAAIWAAIVAGVLWLMTGWAFSRFVAAATSYTAIYSAFASLVLLLIWLNVNWTIVLIGADVAFYIQHPQALKRPSPTASPAEEAERLGLAIIAEIVRRQYATLPPPSAEDLEQALQRPSALIGKILDDLRRAELLALTDDETPHFVLLRPAETTAADRVLAAVRGDADARATGVGIADVVATAVANSVAAKSAEWSLKALAPAVKNDDGLPLRKGCR